MEVSNLNEEENQKYEQIYQEYQKYIQNEIKQLSEDTNIDVVESSPQKS